MIKAALPLTLATLTTVGICRADVPLVAADIAPVHSLVAQVMGTLGEPALVVSPGASPHSYSMRPSEAKALQDADIVFWISAGLTPWLSDSIDTLAPDATQVELLELSGTTELDKRESALFEAHEHHGDERDEGEHHEEAHEVAEHHEEDEHHDAEEEHAEGEHKEGEEHTADAAEVDHDHAGDAHDPHAWLDPSNAAVWLENIAEQLSQADPQNSEAYAANAATGIADLAQLKTDVNVLLAPVRGRNFIVFHDAYQYFENAFDLPAAGAISISDASKPGPARIQQIQDRVVDANVICVLAEPQFNPDMLKTVLDGTQAGSSVIDPLGSTIKPGAALYSQLVRELAQTLADCL